MSRQSTCSFRGYCITRKDCDICINYIEDLSNERDCVPGQIRRTCVICEFELEISMLREENAKLKAELEQVKSSFYWHATEETKADK